MMDTAPDVIVVAVAATASASVGKTISVRSMEVVGEVCRSRVSLVDV